MAVHEGLEHHLAVVGEGQPDGGLQLIAVMGLGDAHAGTGVGGLDEDGPAQLCDDTVADAVGVRLDLPAGGGEPPGVRDAGGVEHGVGHSLVHADRAGQNAAAYVGDAGQFQQALHGAVLAPQAVEHGDDHVHMDLLHLPGGGEEDEAVVGTVGAEHTGHIARQLFPAAVGHLGRVGLGIEPAALFGDADGQQLVPLAVELVHEGAGGHAADLVLAGHSAEQDDHTHFMFRIG